MNEGTAEPATPSAERSLFDGFEGYRTPTDADYAGVFSTGIIVLDTNILLNLYRYNAGTRNDVFAVIERLGDRIWIPHQVLVEFWRNREIAIRELQETSSKAIDALQALRDQATSELRRWVNRVALDSSKTSELEEGLVAAFDLVCGAVEEIGRDAPAEAGDTNTDPIVQRLERLLRAHIGEPFGSDEVSQLLQEGRRRIGAGIPPGYLDAGKDGESSGERSVGDYLVWEQILRESADRKVDVLLVTGDVKEDWWRRERGQTRGPRIELVQELRNRSGAKLFMLRPESFLLRARSLLQLAIEETSLKDVERVDREFRELVAGGWTVEAIKRLMERLWDEAGVQWRAICFAVAEGDGFIGRETVYALGDYGSERTLRGFTRPVSRIAQGFRSEGRVHPGAIDVLQAVYPVGQVQAAGFRVPSEVVVLVRAYMEQANVERSDYEPGASGPAPAT